MTKPTNHLFVCDCGDVDHQFIVVEPPESWFTEYPEEPRELWVHVHLRQDLTWFQKLKYAFLYLIGKQSIYGAFGEIILKKDDVLRLKEICDNYLDK